MVRRGAVVVAVMVVALLAGCASDGRPDAALEPPPVSTSTTDPTASSVPSSDAQSASNAEIPDEAPAGAPADVPLDESADEPAGPPVAAYVSADTSALTIGPVGGVPAVTFDYFASDADQVIAALTTAFGFAPSLNPNRNEYRWQGFALYTAHLPGDYPETPGFYVWVREATVGAFRC
jgi:hypothetical protein